MRIILAACLALQIACAPIPKGYDLQRTEATARINTVERIPGRIRLNSDGLYVYDAVNPFPRVKIGRLDI